MTKEYYSQRCVSNRVQTVHCRMINIALIMIVIKYYSTNLFMHCMISIRVDLVGASDSLYYKKVSRKLSLLLHQSHKINESNPACFIAARLVPSHSLSAKDYV